MVQIERHPELHKLRSEEQAAFDAMFPNGEKASLNGYMEWEDKHLFRRASEHRHLYSQGVKDGIQLIIALLNDSSHCK